MQAAETLRRQASTVLAAASALLLAVISAAPVIVASTKSLSARTIEDEAVDACAAAGYTSGIEALGCVAGYQLGARRATPASTPGTLFPGQPGSGGGSTIMRPVDPDALKMQFLIDGGLSARGGGTELTPQR